MTSNTVACPQCGQRNRVPSGGRGKPRCGRCQSWLPWIVTAVDSDFADVAEGSSVPVLVDLWATWCGPCRTLSPALEQLATERAGSLKLVKVDVDNAPQLSQRFHVQAVPTLLLLDGGRVLARQSGAAPLAALRSWLDGAL
ncbi:MAG: thioredoxin [Actinomycetota bacterium]|nr:thioredoxin [Actinomycetota bacterium]